MAKDKNQKVAKFEKVWMGDQLVERKIVDGKIQPKPAPELKEEPEEPKEEKVEEKSEEEAEVEEESYYTVSELKANQKADLQKMCTEKGLDTDGTKDEIIDRLMSYQEEKKK